MLSLGGPYSTQSSLDLSAESRTVTGMFYAYNEFFYIFLLLSQSFGFDTPITK